MHALLFTLGSYGDVHPFLGLGLQLRQRGHRVTLLTNGHFRGLAEAHGLEFVAVGTSEEYQTLSRDPDLWHARRGGVRVLGLIGKHMRQAYSALAELAGPQSVVATSTLGIAARILQETHGTPVASVHLAPFVFRSLHDPPRLPGMFPLAWLPRFAQRRFWDGADRFVLDPLLARPINELRRELGLREPVSKIMDKWWHSPQRILGMWPRWFAPPPPDWPAQTRLCGFPLYDERETCALSAELDGWLCRGDAPVAFTPGSAMMHGERFFRAAIGACRRLGLRAVLLSRSDHHIPANLPAGVIHVPFAPFGALLPRCRALVHHGGIGTLSQAIAAGVPQVIMPMAHDQSDNAARLRRLGAGVSLSPRRFTERRLAKRLTRLLLSPEAPRIALRRQELRSRLTNEDALGIACDELEQLVSLAPRSATANNSEGEPASAGGAPRTLRK